MRFSVLIFLSLLSLAGWAGPKDKEARALRDVCRLIRDHLASNYSDLDYAAKSIFDDTDSPLDRAVAMKVHPALGPVTNPVKNSRNRDGSYKVEWNGNEFSEVAAVNAPAGLDSVLYQSSRGLIIEGSQLVVPWAHGWTAVNSHGGGVLNQVNYMNSRADRSDVKNHFKVSSMTIDYPFHGASTRDPRYLQFRDGLDWRHKYFRHLSGQSRGLPIVPGTRSAENIPVSELNLRYPGLFKAMIFMSPVHPFDGITEGLRGYHEDNVATDLKIFPKSFHMFENMIEEVRNRKDSWANVEHPFGDPPTPTLILIGANDPETSQFTRDKYKQYAQKYPGVVYYVEIPGATHNVFELKSKEDRARFNQAWNYVYWFLKKHGLDETVALPGYGFMLGERS